MPAKKYRARPYRRINEVLTLLANEAADPLAAVEIAEKVGRAVHHDMEGDPGDTRIGLKRFATWMLANPIATIADPVKWSSEQWAMLDDWRQKVTDADAKVVFITADIAKAKKDRKNELYLDPPGTNAQGVSRAQRQHDIKAKYGKILDDAEAELTQTARESEDAHKTYDLPFETIEGLLEEQQTAGKVLITFDDNDLQPATNQLVELLSRPDEEERVYTFAGGLAYIRSHQVPERYSRGDQARICPYNVDSLTVRLTQVAHFQRVVYGKEVMLQPCAMDRNIAQQILSRGWETISPLRSVSFSPVVTANGTILDKPGYYPEYGLVLRFDEDDYKDISDTDEAAKEAYKLIDDEVMSGFQFAHPSDRSAAHLALATAALYGGFDANVPTICVSSIEAQSGKTILAKMLGAVAMETIPFPTPWKDDDTEMGKLITTLIYEGSQIVLFDNLTRGATIESPILDAIVTGGGWRDRILGFSKSDISGCKPPLIVVTGNNVSYGGDARSRGLSINLTLPIDGFNEDKEPCSVVLADRPRFIRAVLTIIKAGIRRNRHDLGDERFRFPEWNRVIRSAYVHGGFGRMIETVDEETLKRGDPILEKFTDPIPIQRPGSSVKETSLELDRVQEMLATMFGENKKLTSGNIADEITALPPHLSGKDEDKEKDQQAQKRYDDGQELKKRLVDLGKAERRKDPADLGPSQITKLLSGQVGRAGRFQLHKEIDKNRYAWFWVTRSEWQ